MRSNSIRAVSSHLNSIKTPYYKKVSYSYAIKIPMKTSIMQGRVVVAIAFRKIYTLR